MSGEMTPTEYVLAAVRNERVRQDRKWGEQNHDLTVWLTVLMEEVGEAAQAILWARGGDPDGRATTLDIARELVQVAAVAVAAVEFIDRGCKPSEPGA